LFNNHSAAGKSCPAKNSTVSIGALCHQTANLQHLNDKDAILVISFGTTQKQARQNAIENITNKIQAAYPLLKIVSAFTSHIVIRRIKENENLKYNTPEQALDKLAADGYTRIAIVALDIIPGIEYAYKQKVFELYKNHFKKMTMSTPLLYWQGQKNHRDDINDVFATFLHELPIKKDNFDALLVFAHGTKHPANAYYTAIQARLNCSRQQPPVFVYTAEGYPDLSSIIPMLKINNYKRLLLLPFMIVAGEHVYNDMNGDSMTSHKSLLQRQNFRISTYLHGLGENETICRFFLDRTKETYQLLVN
jgi:sirohydrochlorin cobaltochelatase